MALPTNKIKKVKLPNNTEYEIIPERLQGANFRYAFEVGQTLTSNSTRIYFDREYETQLANYLAGLTYDSSNPLGVPICNLMTVNNSTWGNSYYLIAVDLTSQNMGYVLATFDDYSAGSQYHLTVRYATASGSGYGMTWEQGYNNLDTSDGFFFIGEDLASCTVATLNSGHSTWNGYYIYADEGAIITGTKYEAKLPPLPHDSVLALQSDLENYVDKTTNQEIDGTKTFLDRPLSKDTYTQLAYIQSPATSASVFPYIRTGIIKDVQYTTKLTCILDGYFTASQSLGFCGYDSGGQLGQSSGVWSTEAGSSSVNCVGSSNRATIKQVIDFSNAKDTLYKVSGSTETQIAQRAVSSASGYATAADYPLFVAYNGAFTYKPAKLVMYSFKMYDQTDTLLRDYIPVRNSKNEVGLLDLVENKFYKNLGNEDFIAGSDVTTLAIDSQLLTSDDVADVALSGSYNDLTNKPVIVNDVKINNTTVVSSGQANIVTNTAYNASTNKIATMADIPSVPITNVKTLKTDNTTAQSTSSSESIAGSGTINLHKVAKTGTYSDLIGKPTIPTVSTTGVTDGTNTYNASDKLDKLTYEWNKSVAMGSSGYVKIGSFPMYDSNITIDIDATTAQTYHGTVVIATQNTSTTSMGSAHKVEVYDDPSGEIASAIRVVWTSGSRNYDVYFVPKPWSKNLIHIRAVALSSTATDVCISQTGTAPTSTSGLEAVNKLATVAGTGSYTDLTNKPTIPIVNNNTITLTQGGVTKGSFTLNQNSDQTIALDGGGAADYNDLTNKPIINAEAATSTPFETGTIHIEAKPGGDRLYFNPDPTVINNCLNNLTYNSSLNPSIDAKVLFMGQYNSSNWGVLAFDSYDTEPDIVKGIIVGINNNYYVLYADKAGSFTLNGVTYTFNKGYNTTYLDSDKSFGYLPESSLPASPGADATVTTIGTDDWNGIIIGSTPYDGYDEGVYYKMPDENGLTPIVVGDSYEIGDKLYFNLDKESDLLSYIQATCLNEGDSYSPFTMSGDSALIFAHAPNDLYYAIVMERYTNTVVYSNQAFSEGGITVVEGWNNLDSDGGVALAEQHTISTVVDNSQNGILYGNLSQLSGAIYRCVNGSLKKVLNEGDVESVTISSTGVTDGTNTYNASDKMDKVNPTGTGSLSINRKDNTTIGENSVAVGINTTASAIGAFAEGNNTIASGGYSHAEGNSTKSLGNNAHAEGYGTIAKDLYSHAEGYGSQSTATITGAANATSYTLGNITSAEIGNILFYNDIYAKVTAKSGTTITLDKTLSNTALSNVSAAVINGIAYGYGSHVEGYGNTAGGNYSHAEGRNTKAFEECTHAEGYSNSALGKYSHVEGQNNIASGASSHAEGASTQAIGTNSHAEGHNTAAKGDYSHAEGETTYALGNHSHVEGYHQKQNLTITGAANATTYTVNSGINYVLMGSVIYRGNNWTIVTSVSGTTITVANTLSAEALSSGAAYVAWGVARGDKSHAEGSSAASGSFSHSEGYSTTAYGSYSHAEGYYTIANHKSQHVFGDYNIADSSTNASSSHGKYIEIVGNGTGNGSSRSNARTLDWSGNEWLAGGLTIGASATLSYNSTTASLDFIF